MQALKNRQERKQLVNVGQVFRSQESQTDSVEIIIDGLFKQQKEFILHESKNKAGLCSRRAGKTYAMCAYLCISALRKVCLCGYIAITRRSAKLLLWAELKRFNLKYNLGVKFNESDLLATFPNGSRVLLGGAEHKDEIEKFRGHAFDLVVIDEAGAFKPHITELIEDVLEPTLIDTQGTICLIGTPNAACVGYFNKITTRSSEWKVFKWTLLQNPFIPHAKAYLEKKKKEKNWKDDNPIYRREYWGEWVRSTESIVYQFVREINEIEGLPQNESFQYILGIDYGYVDATAFAICAYSDDLPVCFFVYCEQDVGMIPTEIADRTKELDDIYKFVAIVGDTGGLGKPIVEETNKRHSMNIKAAEKRDKYDFIELFNDDLRTERILALPETEEWKEEAEILQWDEDRRKEQEGYSNHLCDAFLYAWREAKHWIYEAEEPEPEPGTKEFYKAEEERIMQEIEDRLTKQIEDEEEWYA